MCDLCKGVVEHGETCEGCGLDGSAKPKKARSTLKEDPKHAEWRGMSFSRLEADLQNAVYAATELFEVLEHTGHFRGNGHHARQEAAAAAAKILSERWEGQR